MCPVSYHKIVFVHLSMFDTLLTVLNRVYWCHILIHVILYKIDVSTATYLETCNAVNILMCTALFSTPVLSSKFIVHSSSLTRFILSWFCWYTFPCWLVFLCTKFLFTHLGLHHKPVSTVPRCVVFPLYRGVSIVILSAHFPGWNILFAPYTHGALQPDTCVETLNDECGMSIVDYVLILQYALTRKY